MNATPLPSNTLRQRAAAAIRSWQQWRTTRGLAADHIIDAGVFASLLVVWTIGYVALNPPVPAKNHRHVDFAQVQR